MNESGRQNPVQLNTPKNMKQVVKHVPDPDEALARAGMIAPQPILLVEGTYIYRFASSDAHFGYHAGVWWIDQEAFDQIAARAKIAGTDLSLKARKDLAVLPKWGSKMNVCVEAKVVDRLRAWKGLAKPQQQLSTTGRVIRMFGNAAIKQLFVCGVVDRNGMLTPKGRHSLAVTGAKVIPVSTLR